MNYRFKFLIVIFIDGGIYTMRYISTILLSISLGFGCLPIQGMNKNNNQNNKKKTNEKSSQNINNQTKEIDILDFVKKCSVKNRAREIPKGGTRI